MIGLREYALIAVIVALGALGWRWWHLEGEVRAQAATIAGYADALTTANERLDGLDAAVAEKLEQDDTARRALARRERQLEDLTREDPDIRAWADQRIPDRVRALDAPDDGVAAGVGADEPVHDRGPDLNP